jgi:deoxyadenosine/deoxycytidine kinase
MTKQLNRMDVLEAHIIRLVAEIDAMKEMIKMQNRHIEHLEKELYTQQQHQHHLDIPGSSTTKQRFHILAI